MDTGMDTVDDLSEQPSHSSSGYGSTSWDLDSTAENLPHNSLMEEVNSSHGILEDLGISILDEEGSMDVSNSELLANIDINAITNSPNVAAENLIVPGAPRVMVQHNPSADVVLSSYYDIDHTEDIRALPTIRTPKDSSHLFKHAIREFEGDNQWNRLSDEMMLALLSWLPRVVLVRCARVCRRWARLCFDESLWRRLDLSGKCLRSGVLGRIVNRGVVALRLSKTEIDVPIYTDLPSRPVLGTSRFNRLQFLDLTMSTISSEGLEQFLKSCQHLQKLSLENCTLTEQSCKYIGQNKNIQVLNLCMSSGITENGLVPICNNLQRLESLNIGWTGMTRGAVVYLLICLPSSLQRLNLSGCRETLQDEDIQQLCSSCPNLKELDLSDATLLSSESLSYISSHLHTLEYLALSRCYHIEPQSLGLLRSMSTLIAIDIFGMLKDSNMRQLQAHLGEIEVNKYPFSSIARPTTGIRRTSIWGLRVRDQAV